MKRLFLVLTLTGLLALSAAANTFSFTTGDPDGRMGTLSRVTSPGKIQTETADDFILNQSLTTINQATFVGLIPTGIPLSSIGQVEIEFYHLFPKDSGPFDGRVTTRNNSPADVEIDAATRDSLAGTLSYTVTLLNQSFNVANTVVNGIHPLPDEFTGGEGPATGQEVLINVVFNTPVVLGPDHYFFRPEALVDGGDFLWLSTVQPQFPGDLQTWIRNDDLAPDWLRVGTDITGQGPFDAAFSLSGTTVPEPSTWMLLAGSLGSAAYWRRKIFK